MLEQEAFNAKFSSTILRFVHYAISIMNFSQNYLVRTLVAFMPFITNFWQCIVLEKILLV